METVIGKKMKFRARDPLSALTHFIGFLAVIPPGAIGNNGAGDFLCNLRHFSAFAIWCKHNLSYPVPCSRKNCVFKTN